jgi:hypothetical protein
VGRITLISRRRLLGNAALTVALTPLALCKLSLADGVGATLINPADPAAKAVKYVEDAKYGQGATVGSKCANCALYLGASSSVEGRCQIFPGKDVKAAGWCTSWAPQM